MLLVTGGAGFIGSNIVAALNAAGRDDITVVDDLTDGTKFRNLADLRIADYLDKGELSARLRAHGAAALSEFDAVFHMGACSATTEWDGRFMMDNNYRYSVDLLDACLAGRVPLIYASSAAVYGMERRFEEHPDNERPLNVYGYSKLLFDQVVRRRLPTAESQVVGLRFFNVYGPREQHKGTMASTAWHFHNQLLAGDTVRLFEGSDGYADGEQRRDFVYVDDVVAVMTWLHAHPDVSGIFNVGTGRSQPFNDIARAVVAHHGRGRLTYIPFPEHLVGRYQAYTQADLTKLRATGCDVRFRDVAEGVSDYLAAITAEPAR